mgnify:CR=1 FL=1
MSKIPQLRIKDILKEQGKNQNWLVAEIGVSASNLSKMLSGNRGLQTTTLMKMSKALNVPYKELFKDEPPYKPFYNEKGERIGSIKINK